MGLDWNDLKYFLTAAREKSITAAAKTLKVNQSTVLRRIDQMEARLGMTLFIREKGSCVLTEDGNTVFLTAQRMAEQAQELEAQLSGSKKHALSGNITVSAADFVVTHLLLPKLAAFSALNPGISVTFKSTNEFLNLAQRDADIVVRLTDSPDRHLTDNLFGRHLGDIELCAYRGKQSDEKKLSWLSWGAEVGFKAWISQNGYPALPVRACIDSALVQLESVKTGDYAAILPCFAGDRDDSLTRLKGCKSFKGFEVWLLTHTDLKDIARVSATMQYLSGALKAGIDR